MIRNSKGCMFADPQSPDYKKNTEEMISGYDSPEFAIMDGCPVETAIKYPFLYDFCASISNSQGFYMPSLPILHAAVYNAFIIDRNVVQEQNNKARRRNE